MKKWIGLLFFLLAGTQNLLAKTTEEIVKETVQPYMAKLQISGVSVAVYDGRSAQIINFGYADVQKERPVANDTIFEIASITKVFTATALAFHILNHTVSLDDPVTKYLPAISRNIGNINDVTLQELATHTSALPRVPPPLPNHKRYTKASVLTYLQNWRPTYPIGRRYLYSNLGFGVLGYALTFVDGRPFAEMITREILTPLQMNSTYVQVPLSQMYRYAQGYGKDGSPRPRHRGSPWPAAGALRSTPQDMLNFLLANLSLKGPENLQECMRFAQKPYFKVNDQLTMGLGWQRVTKDNLLIVDKNGGLPGFSSYIGFLPDRKIGVVILANKAKIKSTKLGRMLLQRLNQGG